MIDELDRCMDNMAMSVEEGVSRLRESVSQLPRPQEVISDARTAAQGHIDASVARFRSALIEVRLA